MVSAGCAQSAAAGNRSELSQKRELARAGGRKRRRVVIAEEGAPARMGEPAGSRFLERSPFYFTMTYEYICSVPYAPEFVKIRACPPGVLRRW